MSPDRRFCKINGWNITKFELNLVSPLVNSIIAMIIIYLRASIITCKSSFQKSILVIGLLHKSFRENPNKHLLDRSEPDNKYIGYFYWFILVYNIEVSYYSQFFWPVAVDYQWGAWWYQTFIIDHEDHRLHSDYSQWETAKLTN